MSAPTTIEDHPGPLARYQALVASGSLDADPAQARLVERLDGLARDLAGRARNGRGSSPFAWLFGGGAKSEPAPRGVYIWGEVGRGKTMLMDLFFEGLAVERKRRAHFHAYMGEVHARIHAWRQKSKAGTVSGEDPIRAVAADLAAEASVLCFDEFAVTDIADAMILGRLFTALFADGVVVVATSNRQPQDLYKEGLNRALFMPFIRLLEERTEVLRLESRTDFRLEKLGDTPVYFTPLGDRSRAAMDELFGRLTGGAPVSPTSLAVLGRSVPVPRQAMGVARFTFAELCERPLAAADYLAIARAFHTVFLDDVPQLRPEQRNEAKRFIILIDVLYERHVKLVASAAVGADDLYRGERGAETFEIARTASRLHEMSSREYLAASRHEPLSGNATGLVET